MKVDNRFYKDDMFNNDRSVECARWQNLVYVRTLKAGSEFFYRNFTETAGWLAVPWQDIDWSRDHVFSYIMDPIQRRHKGIAEWLFVSGTDHLLQDPAFCRLVAQIPFMEEHSARMRDLYGERVHDIEWIPLSQTDHQQGQRLTDKLLAEHGQQAIAWNPNFIHTTENYMGATYRRLRELWDAEDIIGVARFYFQEDVELYLSALRRNGLLLE